MIARVRRGHEQHALGYEIAALPGEHVPMTGAEFNGIRGGSTFHITRRQKARERIVGGTCTKNANLGVRNRCSISRNLETRGAQIGREQEQYRDRSRAHELTIQTPKPAS